MFNISSSVTYGRPIAYSVLPDFLITYASESKKTEEYNMPPDSPSGKDDLLFNVLNEQELKKKIKELI